MCVWKTPVQELNQVDAYKQTKLKDPKELVELYKIRFMVPYAEHYVLIWIIWFLLYYYFPSVWTTCSQIGNVYKLFCSLQWSCNQSHIVVTYRTSWCLGEFSRVIKLHVMNISSADESMYFRCQISWCSIVDWYHLLYVNVPIYSLMRRRELVDAFGYQCLFSVFVELAWTSIIEATWIVLLVPCHISFIFVQKLWQFKAGGCGFILSRACLLVRAILSKKA